MYIFSLLLLFTSFTFALYDSINTELAIIFRLELDFLYNYKPRSNNDVISSFLYGTKSIDDIIKQYGDPRTSSFNLKQFTLDFFLDNVGKHTTKSGEPKKFETAKDMLTRKYAVYPYTLAPPPGKDLAYLTNIKASINEITDVFAQYKSSSTLKKITKLVSVNLFTFSNNPNLRSVTLSMPSINQHSRELYSKLNFYKLSENWDITPKTQYMDVAESVFKSRMLSYAGAITTRDSPEGSKNYLYKHVTFLNGADVYKDSDKFIELLHQYLAKNGGFTGTATNQIGHITDYNFDKIDDLMTKDSTLFADNPTASSKQYAHIDTIRSYAASYSVFSKLC